MSSIFANKRVALIGPAPHIVALDQREYLETFDVIVRLNHALPLPPRVAERTTNRTDVLYVDERTEPCQEWGTLQEIRVRPSHAWDSPETLRRWRPWRRKIIFTHPKHSDAFWPVVGNPNQGLTATSDILDARPELLYITGLTFYIGEKVYAPYYGARLGARAKELEQSRGAIYGHEPAKQLRYFIDHFCPFVAVDEVLQRIVKEFR